MNIQWNAVAAIGGLITATIAIIALVVGGRRSRIALQTDLLLKYYDEFYSPEMHKVRRTAVQKLIAGKSPNYELEDVLDYFGIIGALLERKALDHELTYGLFDFWILRYWCCAQEYIAARRQDPEDPAPEMWSCLERLVNGLLAYRKEKGATVITDGAARRFLREEGRSEDGDTSMNHNLLTPASSPGG